MKTKNDPCEIDFKDEDEWVDYPYLGIGRKPKTKGTFSEEDLEKII